MRRGQTPEVGSIPTVPGGDYIFARADMSESCGEREKKIKRSREFAAILPLFLDESARRQKIVT